MSDQLDEIDQKLLERYARAQLLQRYAMSDPFDPVYPYHGCPRRCPFCDTIYRRHGGFVDHRDRCEEGPNPGANPATSPREYSRAAFHVGDFIALFIAVLVAIFASVGIVLLVVMPP